MNVLFESANDDVRLIEIEGLFFLRRKRKWIELSHTEANEFLGSL